jgi:hypothetical protein
MSNHSDVSSYYRYLKSIIDTALAGMAVKSSAAAVVRNHFVMPGQTNLTQKEKERGIGKEKKMKDRRENKNGGASHRY